MQKVLFTVATLFLWLTVNSGQIGGEVGNSKKSSFGRQLQQIATGSCLQRRIGGPVPVPHVTFWGLTAQAAGHFFGDRASRLIL